MTTTPAPGSVTTTTTASRGSLLDADPAHQAFVLLRTAFTVAPVAFGLDKFANLLVDWPRYLAPVLNDVVPGSAQQAMYLVGVIEIVAGLVVALRPTFGAPLVAVWLLGIITDLLLVPGYYDVALRDVGLLAGALALWRLAVAERERRLRAR